MPNTTKRITTPTRFALLALGAISLSALAASPAAAQNASACRSSIGIAGDFAERCLVTPEGNLSTAITSSVGKVNAAAQGNSNYSRDLSNVLNSSDPSVTDAADSAEIARQVGANNANRYKFGRDDYDPSANKGGGVKTTAGKGGNGGAAGRTGSRIAPTRTTATAAVPTPTKSTTFDKATNTTTRDHRTGATAAPGGPPPAAAIGSSSKATPEQLAAQSGTRDHRHK
jgi:hypothetical protein